MVFVCQKCSEFVHGCVGSAAIKNDGIGESDHFRENENENEHDDNKKVGSSSSSSSSSPTTTTTTEPYCAVCLGLLQSNFQSRLQGSIDESLKAYSCRDGSNNWNRFSRQVSPPTIILPGDLVFRFCCAASRKRRQQSPHNLKNTTSPALTVSPSSGCVVNYVHHIKQLAKRALLDCVNQAEKDNKGFISGTGKKEDYPRCIADEELGYLGIHVILAPKSNIKRPKEASLRSDSTRNATGRVSRKKQMMTLDGPQQGGDPRQNHEWRLTTNQNNNNNHSDNVAIWTINQAMDSSYVHKWQGERSEFLDNAETTATTESAIAVDALDIHVAIWRCPFYLGGCYTKTRRDVSQTPFYVTDKGKRQRLGVTSVEEQILPAITRCCGGISTLNNKQGSNAEAAVVYGMAKFHASGREDMDVRMIVPSLIEGNGTNGRATTKQNISGRPFVCEIIDAFVMPTPSALQQIVEEINGGGNNNAGKADSNDDKPGASLSSLPYYGSNPMGVGIAPNLEFVSSSCFKNLQAQTESKVKHYGCLCWSQVEIPDDDEALNKLLGSFPLEIQQRTPIRVLHRRSNMVRTRHVLTCRATRIDNHFFRLSLSTDAGTYVKEFVHGDLGRTIPSVSTLLSCKTDILELDCEGIQQD
ncbi:hypothetical protein ACA910_010823 [Epithemia clementina (nom. ined.)]